MKILKMPKENLDLFVAVLPAFGEVYAPIKRGKAVVFGRPKLWSDVVMNYKRTILPPKKFFLPQREVTFRFSPEEGFKDTLEEAAKPIVLFGVHPYDIYAINLLDKVFAEGPYKDPYYITRRKNVAIIGIEFEPDELHFAHSLGTDFVSYGFDIFLSDIGDYYLVFVGSSKGDDMVTKSGCLMEKPTEEDFAEYKRRSNERRKRESNVLVSDMPEVMEMDYNSKVWDEIGRRCLSCGSCAMVCPTCYCFDVNDKVELGTRKGERIRSWDSCNFVDHALVAGGHNFRGTRTARIKFRFYHKLRGFVAEYGQIGCVGCGRCAAVCPSGLGIKHVIEMVRGESL